MRLNNQVVRVLMPWNASTIFTPGDIVFDDSLEMMSCIMETEGGIPLSDLNYFKPYRESSKVTNITEFNNNLFNDRPIVKGLINDIISSRLIYEGLNNDGVIQNYDSPIHGNIDNLRGNWLLNLLNDPSIGINTSNVNILESKELILSTGQNEATSYIVQVVYSIGSSGFDIHYRGRELTGDFSPWIHLNGDDYYNSAQKLIDNRVNNYNKVENILNEGFSAAEIGFSWKGQEVSFSSNELNISQLDSECINLVIGRTARDYSFNILIDPSDITIPNDVNYSLGFQTSHIVTLNKSLGKLIFPFSITKVNIYKLNLVNYD